MFEDLITDRTLEDVKNRTAKGHYNASDLNRVEHAVKEISELLTKEAYPVAYQPHKRLVSTEEWDENTVLLLHAEDFTDSSMYNVALTNINTQIVDDGKFSKCFDFVYPQEIKTPQVIDFNKIFTVEFWSRIRSKKEFTHFICQPVVGGFKIRLNQNKISAELHQVGSPIISTFSPEINTWFHIAVTGENKKINIFVNGKKVGSGTFTSDIPQEIIRIGLNVVGDSVGSIDGNIDELRISNVIRYLTDFNVQAEPFSAKIGSTEYGESDWVEPENYEGIPDRPTASEMERYLHNVEEIKRQFYQKKSTPTLPKQMSRLKHSGANAIEQLIVDTNDLLIETEKAKRKSGTFKAGELLP